MNNSCKLFAITLFGFLAFSSCFYDVNGVLAQTDQTSAMLQATNIAVGQAFNAVFDAEKAGSNVTQLLANLNTAGELLADAQNALNSGNNVSNITSMAESATQIAVQVKGDALHLRDVSLVESRNIFLLTVILSIIGTVVFLVSLLFVWSRFKRSYMKKLFGMKPEVV